MEIAAVLIHFVIIFFPMKVLSDLFLHEHDIQTRHLAALAGIIAILVTAVVTS